jgi:hypothetical protein
LEEITSNNISALSSTFITIYSGANSQRAVVRANGSYVMPSGSVTSDLFRLDEAEHFYLRDAFCANPGRSYVAVDPTNGPSHFCHISGLESENGVEPAYCVAFLAAGGASTCTGWTITQSYLRADTRAIYAGANVVLDNFRVNSITEAANRGIEVVGTAQFCAINIPTTILIGTEIACELTGDPTQWTLGTSSGYWTDRRANHNFTYGTSGVTITGALVINNAKAYAHGHEVIANLVLAAETSIVCSAGATITGLPWSSLATNYSAQVQVVNVNTGAAIAGGYVNGTTIVLPAINVGASVAIAISARYLRTA